MSSVDAVTQYLAAFQIDAPPHQHDVREFFDELKQGLNHAQKDNITFTYNQEHIVERLLSQLRVVVVQLTGDELIRAVLSIAALKYHEGELSYIRTVVRCLFAIGPSLFSPEFDEERFASLEQNAPWLDEIKIYFSGRLTRLSVLQFAQSVSLQESVTGPTIQGSGTSKLAAIYALCHIIKDIADPSSQANLALFAYFREAVQSQSYTAREVQQTASVFSIICFLRKWYPADDRRSVVDYAEYHNDMQNFIADLSDKRVEDLCLHSLPQFFIYRAIRSDKNHSSAFTFLFKLSGVDSQKSTFTWGAELDTAGIRFLQYCVSKNLIKIMDQLHLLPWLLTSKAEPYLLLDTVCLIMNHAHGQCFGIYYAIITLIHCVKLYAESSDAVKADGNFYNKLRGLVDTLSKMPWVTDEIYPTEQVSHWLEVLHLLEVWIMNKPADRIASRFKVKCTEAIVQHVFALRDQHLRKGSPLTSAIIHKKNLAIASCVLLAEGDAAVTKRVATLSHAIFSASPDEHHVLVVDGILHTGPQSVLSTLRPKVGLNA